MTRWSASLVLAAAGLLPAPAAAQVHGDPPEPGEHHAEPGEGHPEPGAASGTASGTASGAATTPTASERYGANPIHASLLVGAGVPWANPGHGAYGAAFGARLGYTAAYGLYTGFLFTYHFGTPRGVGCPIPRPGVSDLPCPSHAEDARMSSQYAFEVGWNFALGPVRAQPYLALGLLSLGDPPIFGGDNVFFVAPGVLVLVPLPLWHFFVGADGRLVVLPSERTGTYGAALYGTVGFTFGG